MLVGRGCQRKGHQARGVSPRRCRRRILQRSDRTVGLRATVSIASFFRYLDALLVVTRTSTVKSTYLLSMVMLLLRVLDQAGEGLEGLG